MPSPLQSLDESLAYEEYTSEDCRFLEGELVKLRRYNTPLNLSQHPELYEYVKAKADYLQAMIERGDHHNDSLCYLRIFDLIYLVKLLPKEERKKYL